MPATTVTAAVLPRQLSAVEANFRHNPYACVLLTKEDSMLSERSCQSIYGVTSTAGSPLGSEAIISSAGFALPVPASVAAAAKAKEAALELSNDDGVSEGGTSENDSVPKKDSLSRHPSVVRDPSSDSIATGSVCVAPFVVNPGPAPLLRYASVNFRFGSAWFLAPFRTQAGDMVVVEYPGSSHSLHMGIVSGITTEKPETFYSEENTDPNYLSPEETAVLPRLLRHARDFDKETKMDLRSHDIRSLTNAQALAMDLGAPVTFLDAEWLLDLSAITFLVHVYGDISLVDHLADELAGQEGAEVVFTFPASA